ncbi:MAG: S8 family serine peptidase [Clostridia bacterium]|nr:S8 family serine peptidase [Clostridia bacterium]
MAILVCPDGLALADSSAATVVDWQELYDDYIGEGDGDWYLGEDYLDLYGAMEAVHDMVNDPKFNKDALKADPIVIASIDNGIGASYAYNDAYGTEVRVGFSHVVIDQKDAVFKVHPIFDGVILTDENGDYVYGNTAQEIYFTDKNGNMSLIVFANNGDIGHDLVSFDKHGVSTTGLIAFFIHMFGLEDYIKIMPINVDDVYYYDSNGAFRQAFTIDAFDRAVIFAREHGADIINASCGGGEPSTYDELASEILIVAAAGNDNKYHLQYPAGSDKVVGVVNYSRDADGEIELYTHSSGGSNYGEWYDIAAPGQNAVSSAYGSYLSSPYTYSVMGGTSMASPFVAFAGALAMFRFRGYDNYGVGIELTPQVYKEMIVSGTDKTVTKVATEGTYTYPVLDLKGIVTADFYSDKEFLANIGISVPEILEIATDAKAEHNVGDIITLSATTNPVGLFAKDKVYWWYVVDGATYDLGYGKEIQFQIPDLEGEYEIYCALEDEEGMPHIQNAVPLEFEVSRKEPESIEIGANIESEYKIDTSAVVELNATIYPANAYTEDTIVWWYELGGEEYTIGTGMTVEFAIPNEVGEYTIYCALQDSEGNVGVNCTNNLVFAVAYYTVHEIEIEENIELKNVVSFSIPTHLLSPDVVETIEWYLNDTLVSKEAQYACAYIFEGEYVITLKIGGQIFEMASFNVEGNESNTPPADGGEDDPVVPPADDEPVTPSTDGGEDDPVVPPADDEPVTPPTDGGEDDPVVPPADDEPVTPPADGGEDDPVVPPTDDEPDTPPADNNQDNSSETEEQNNEKLVVALIISVSVLAVAVISLAVGLIVIFAKKKRLDRDE